MNGDENVSIQIGEPFHCWQCGDVDQGGTFLIIDHSALEAFADHIYYMYLSCGHNPRCVRLGDAVAPLRPLNSSIQQNLEYVREGIQHLASSVPLSQRNQEPVSKIIYLLVAGRISPQTAINKLRCLVEDQVTPESLPLPVLERAWR